jgi:predicted ATPase
MPTVTINRNPTADLPFNPPSLRMRLENFRVFRDSGWFKIAPLTCLVGRNSSGKSSVVSAILLLKQSMEQETMAQALMPLTLSGPLCDLGNYRDVVHEHKQKSEISLSLGIGLAELAAAIVPRRRPAFVELRLPRRRLQTRLGYSRFGYYGYYGPKLPKSGEIEIRFTFSSNEPLGPSLKALEVTITNIGSVKFAGEGRRGWKTSTESFPPRALSLTPYGFFPEIDLTTSSYRRTPKRTKARIRHFANACHAFFSYLAELLSRSDVIGPFRTPPERRYSFGGFSSIPGGVTGEKAVNLLITESLLSPISSRPLHEAVSFWVKHLNLAKSLDIRDIAKRLNLFQVDIKGAGKSSTANLADVGFGVSQVLPVLVQGLLMRRGGIYVVQQPEIHLHPDAQAGLADFFIYLASYGVIAIVETHSEYLLLRLRRRLAEGAKPIAAGLSVEREKVSPLTRKEIAVLFTGVDGGRACVRQLNIGKSFQFENLPHGFMSQALDDRASLLTTVSKSDV